MNTAAESRFSVRVTKDTLVFSAAHFITYRGGVCERLHGHNWRVEAAIDGALDENSYVFDFIELRDGLMALVAEMDHRVLLPLEHPRIAVAVSPDGQEVVAQFENRRWVFPREDCLLLPVANTTAELIARYLAEHLTDRLQLRRRVGLVGLRISVEENFGQWADFHMPLPGLSLQEDIG